MPINITRLEVIKLNLKSNTKYTKLTAINCPIIPIHLKLIYDRFFK